MPLTTRGYRPRPVHRIHGFIRFYALQATTIEMLVVGAAVEEAFSILANEKPQDRESLAEIFAAMLGDLNSRRIFASLPVWRRASERPIPPAGWSPTFAPHCLLDLFCDTSERTPTFMLPCFRLRRSFIAFILGLCKRPDAAQ